MEVRSARASQLYESVTILGETAKGGTGDSLMPGEASLTLTKAITYQVNRDTHSGDSGDNT